MAWQTVHTVGPSSELELANVHAAQLPHSNKLAPKHSVTTVTVLLNHCAAMHQFIDLLLQPHTGTPKFRTDLILQPLILLHVDVSMVHRLGPKLACKVAKMFRPVVVSPFCKAMMQ